MSFKPVVAVFVTVLFLTGCSQSETYPRLVPWRLSAVPPTDVAELAVSASSYACVVDDSAGIHASETFDHVEVIETDETVSISTWLGRSETSGFRRSCDQVGYVLPIVKVELAAPLGDRTLVDPACSEDRFAGIGICKGAKFVILP